MTSPRETCGELYLKALNTWTDMGQDEVRLFAVGFVCGQAEKVYSGACRAAMFRPSKGYAQFMKRVMFSVCDIYGLSWSMVGLEFWIYRSKQVIHISGLRMMLEEGSVDTPEWHRRRAYLCGIPDSETDLEYHSRAGHNRPCDVRAEQEGV